MKLPHVVILSDRVPIAAAEADHHPRWHVEAAQHQSERAGEILAVTALIADDEIVDRIGAWLDRRPVETVRERRQTQIAFQRLGDRVVVIDRNLSIGNLGSGRGAEAGERISSRSRGAGHDFSGAARPTRAVAIGRATPRSARWPPLAPRTAFARVDRDCTRHRKAAGRCAPASPARCQ